MVEQHAPAVQFRKGVPADAHGIAEYYHRCWLTASASSLEPGAAEWFEASMWLDLFHGRLAPDSSMRTVVATSGGVVVGHVQVEGNLLVHLFVDPEHQGAGIGSRLLAIGEALIAEAGHTDAELHTRVDNDQAIAWYRSVGWQHSGRLIHSAHDGIGYDEHVLIKHLERR
jgi:ribosomal protein S18 acetylase RimI-like enzyme